MPPHSQVWGKRAPAGDNARARALDFACRLAEDAAGGGTKNGEAKNSWLTGTAEWNFVAISQYMLGVRPDYDGVRVEPCIDPAVSRFVIRRKCRGASYTIHVTNRGAKGPPKLRVDGEPIAGTLVPYAPAGASVRVDCEC